MFASTCPTYCKSRWHYAYEVMSWLTKREALIQWLEPEAAQTGSSGGEDLSKAEGDGLKKLATDSTERAVFWAMFWAVYLLETWGFRVHSWLKGCPCPCHQKAPHERGVKRKSSGGEAAPGEDASLTAGRKCKLKGRRLIELSCGRFASFLAELSGHGFFFECLAL